jgi:hypothetical protein
VARPNGLPIGEVGGGHLKARPYTLAVAQPTSCVLRLRAGQAGVQQCCTPTRNGAIIVVVRSRSKSPAAALGSLGANIGK